MTKFNDGTIVGEYERPYVVAELNTSHFGDMDLARKMIAECARIGVDCVKFQSWSAETLYSGSYYDHNPIAKRFVKKYSLSEEQLFELSGTCTENQIGFMSTPYSIEEASFLVEKCGVPALKIASMEINNLPFIKVLAQLGSALILSTGMADLEEVETAVETIQAAGCQNLVVLHCVSRYPIKNHEANIRNVQMLRDRLSGVSIGYSDHTEELDAPAAAVALGACLIERHFTLDRSRIGMDNNMATEPEEFAKLIRRCRQTWECMGRYERVVSQGELDQRLNMRRSVAYADDLAAGTALKPEHLVFKRPGTGIAPTEVDSVIGKTLQNDVVASHLVVPSDIELP